MSREIKFRAWDAYRKEMRYSDEGWNENADIFSGVWKSLERAGIIVMQFTGLRDRNGVDIYEGDILRYKDEIASVEYCDGGYELIKGNGKFLMHIYAVLEDSFSILGNLHENADLLDSAKVTENVTGDK